MTDARAAYAPYVPRVAITWDDDAPGQLWQARDATLVFVDISGFTALSERLARRGQVGAEELTSRLNGCFGELLADAYLAGGSLLKFGGDALLLLFDGDDHAVRATNAAIGMRATMSDVGRITTSVGTVRLRMSVGVHSGLVHLFRVGELHHELVVAGPGATTTVEMEATASAGEILVSPSTALRVNRRLLGQKKDPGILVRSRIPQEMDTGSLQPTPTGASDLARSIPDALREDLLNARVESEHRTVTVGFIHFDGTDRLLAERGPDAVAAALDRLVGVAEHAAAAEHVTFLGTDVDRDGGKIILVAGAPRAQGEDSTRMLRAVRRVIDDGGMPVRVGVNRGPVFAGVVGTRYRRAYTVMGDTVNLAARVMAKAAAGEVLATAPVMRDAGPFETTAVEPFSVKGKAKPVEAVAVGAALRSPAEYLEDDLPLVGRDTEMAELRALAESTAAGFGGMVEIIGPPGIGKSRLIREVLGRAPDHRVVTAFCDPFEVQTPYYACRFLLRGLLGPDWASQFEARIRDEEPGLLQWLPLIGDVIDAPVAPTPATQALDPNYRRDQTARVVAEVLGILAPGPTVFVVEDAQWLDQPSADLLRYVGAYAAYQPWLICVLDHETPQWMADAEIKLRIPLQPLDDVAAEALVASDTPGTPLLPHVAQRLVDQAGGNPLFLRELLRAPDVLADPDAVPSSLAALVAVEIDRLPAADRRLLRHAAVLGSTFETALIAAVTDDPDGATSGLRRLGRFLQPVGRAHIRFRNHCYRQVAYDALPFTRRRDLHGRAAQMLEERTDPESPQFASLLSYHNFYARRYQQCWDYSWIAASQAREQFANYEAVELLDRALSVVRHLDLTDAQLSSAWELLGLAAMDGRLCDRAAFAYSRAAKLAGDDPTRLAKLCGLQAHNARYRGQIQGLGRWARRGLSLVADLADGDAVVIQCDLRLYLAQYEQARGHLRAALDMYTDLIGRARAAGEGSTRVLAAALTAADYAAVGLGAAEATHAEEALDLLDKRGDEAQKSAVLTFLGALAYYRGDWTDAVDRWTKASEAARRSGNAAAAGYGTNNIAEVLINQGRGDEVASDVAAAVMLFRSYRDAVGLAGALVNRGRLQLRHGDARGALATFADAVAADTAQQGDVDVARAECHLRLGEVDEALEILDPAIRRATASGDTTFLSALHRLRGYAYLATDRHAAARAAFDTSLEVAQARGSAYDIGLALAARANPADDSTLRDIMAKLGVVALPTPPLPDELSRRRA